MDQHELTKKNNNLMIKMDRKRESGRVAMEKKKELAKKVSSGEMGSGKYKHPNGTSMIGGANPKEIKSYEQGLDKKWGKGNWSRI